MQQLTENELLDFQQGNLNVDFVIITTNKCPKCSMLKQLLSPYTYKLAYYQFDGSDIAIEFLKKGGMSSAPSVTYYNGNEVIFCSSSEPEVIVKWIEEIYNGR